MKYKFLATLLFCLACSLSSCDDFLNRAPGLNLDEKKVFTNYETAYRYHADIYSNLKKGFNVLGSFQAVPLACATDEAEASSGWHSSNDFNTGAYDGVDNVLDNYYSGIRKVNIFLSYKDIIPYPDDEIKKRMIGEVYFLRAFYFHEIIKRYGGMPILSDKILYPNDNLERTRNSYKECVEAILSDLKIAIDLLPAVVDNNSLGSASKGAAMALKSRVLLYAASPLWDSEFNNADKWVIAAQAAKDVIDLNEGGGKIYDLYSTENGAESGADYENQFFLKAPENREVIFWYNDGTKKFTDEEISVWAPAGGEFTGGSGAIWPTQNFVDMFEMKATGKLWNEPGSGYNSDKPFDGKDPRFYKTVLYNGCTWQGTVLETYIGGKHRMKAENCKTGYYVRKYLPESVTANSSNASFHNWQFIRLAEIYLNYAEAINEAEGPTKAYFYINEIRKRSGMKELPTNLSKEVMRERIKRERAIELSFEDHRWWDVKRWKEGVKYFNGNFYGMDITMDNNGKITYSKNVFEIRIYFDKMNLYPIPTTEIDKNPAYIQNPGW